MVLFDLRNFLAVDGCNMDERLESSWHLVYYQVLREPGIAGCSRRSDIYLGECGLACKLIHWSPPHNFIFCVLNFRGWTRPRNYFFTAKFSRSTVVDPFQYATYHPPHACYITWLHMTRSPRSSPSLPGSYKQLSNTVDNERYCLPNVYNVLV